MNKRRKRVPVVLQASAVDCGAACLTMLLNYFEAGATLQECREKCGGGRDGVSAKAMLGAARTFGLKPKAILTSAPGFGEVSLPAIAHWNHCHYIVVERSSEKTVEIVDPANGRRVLNREQFAAGFSGVVLTFEPGAEFVRGRKRGPDSRLRYFRNMLSVEGTGKLLLRIVAASFLLQVLGLAVPVMSKLLVDRLLGSGFASGWHVLAVCALAVAMSQAALSYLRANLLLALETRVDSSLMLKFFEHLMRLPFRFFQERSSGDLLMRLAGNASVRDALANYTMSAVLDGTLVVVYLVVLLRIAPVFGAAALALAVLEIVLMLATARRLKLLVDSDLQAQSESQSYLVEVLAGVSALKASGAEDRASACWRRLLEKNMNASVQRSRYAARVDAGLTLVKTFAPLCLLWVGGNEVMRGEMSLGTMIGINALAAAFLVPVGSLVASAQRLELAAAHLERIRDVVETRPEQDPAHARPAPALSGHIELKNVCFRYQPGGPLTLRDISFTIRPGEKVALVGRTGSGKSTLAKLLLGLYPPESGRILFDGWPLSELDLRSVRNQWGAVLQEPFLFSGTVRDNISFQDPGVSAESIAEAAAMAEIHESILAMPLGYETRLDEMGTSFSGGQRQRVAIARAIVRRPAMLLLDEATSHLDALTEKSVDENLDGLSCTRVVVAHRLSTVRNADRILVLEEGALAGEGTHGELLSRCSLYAALVEAQQQHSDALC